MSSKRNSKSGKSTSHPPENLGQTTPFVRVLPNISKRFINLLEEEERDLIIYSIRDEIINNALDACYQKYLNKQAVKFVTHCAHMALIRIIDLNFYYHDPGRPYYDRHPDWAPDDIPVPSPPDSWAANTIPVLSKEMEEVEEIAPSQPPSMVSISISSHYSDVPSISTLMSDLISVPSAISQSVFELTDDISSVISVRPSASIFTRTKISNVGALPQQLPPNNAKLKEFVNQSEKLPKISVDEAFKVPDIKFSLEKLPPIRALAKFKQNEKEEKKTKRSGGRN